MPVNMVGIIAIILGGMATCDTILTSMCGCHNIEICFTCKWNGAESHLTIDFSL